MNFRPITLKKMEIFDIGKPFSPSSSSTSQTTKSSSTEEEEEEDRGEEVEVDEDGFQKIPPEREEEESEKEQEEEEEEIIIPFHHQVHPLSHEGVTLGEFQVWKKKIGSSTFLISSYLETSFDLISCV